MRETFSIYLYPPPHTFPSFIPFDAHSLTAALRCRRPDQKKPKAKDTAKRAASPAPSDDIPAKVTLNALDDLPKEGFKQGKALIDNAALSSCKWCKKSIMLTNAAEHISACLKIKKDKANRKKAAREARERAKEQAQREEERRIAEEQGIILPDGESGDDGDEEKGAGKSTKKVAGKKAEGDMKGKKRKANDEADKGPKQKKKKEEAKPKTKPKGEFATLSPAHQGGRVIHTPTSVSFFTSSTSFSPQMAIGI